MGDFLNIFILDYTSSVIVAWIGFSELVWRSQRAFQMNLHLQITLTMNSQKFLREYIWGRRGRGSETHLYFKSFLFIQNAIKFSNQGSEGSTNIPRGSTITSVPLRLNGISFMSVAIAYGWSSRKLKRLAASAVFFIAHLFYYRRSNLKCTLMMSKLWSSLRPCLHL